MPLLALLIGQQDWIGTTNEIREARVFSVVRKNDEVEWLVQLDAPAEITRYRFALKEDKLVRWPPDQSNRS
jgi:hypothetical protein